MEPSAPPPASVSASMSLSPNRIEFQTPFDSTRLTATVFDQYGREMTVAIRWSVVPDSVATVTGGLVRPTAPGTGFVRAAVEGFPRVRDSVPLTSFDPPVPTEVVIQSMDRERFRMTGEEVWTEPDTTVNWDCSGSCNDIRASALDQYGQALPRTPTISFAGGDTVWTHAGGGDLKVVLESRSDRVIIGTFGSRDCWPACPADVLPPIIASYNLVSDTLVYIIPGNIEWSEGAWRTMPDGLDMSAGEVVSLDATGWFQQRPDTILIHYSDWIDGTDAHGRDEASERISVRWDDGDVRVTALAGGGATSVGMSLRTDDFRSTWIGFAVAVDWCFTPDDPRSRSISGFALRLAFDGGWSDCARTVFGYAAARWEEILAGNDIPPVEVSVGYMHLGFGFTIAAAWPRGSRVDREDGSFYFNGGSTVWNKHPEAPDIYRPRFGAVSDRLFYETALHELGHVLGIGTYWHDHHGADTPDLQNPWRQGGKIRDTHYPGPNAVAAFDAAGGGAYSGGKVPVSNEGGGANAHWRDILCGEIMTYCRRGELPLSLSAITVGALEDFGWTVNYEAADPYTLASYDMAGARAGHEPWIRDLILPPTGGSR